jgi:hypothetical protein
VAFPLLDPGGAPLLDNQSTHIELTVRVHTQRETVTFRMPQSIQERVRILMVKRSGQVRSISPESRRGPPPARLLSAGTAPRR